MTYPTTIAQFADACKGLTHDEIYCLFEDCISDELRDEIYLTVADDCAEPFREACIAIGAQYNVQSLTDY